MSVCPLHYRDWGFEQDKIIAMPAASEAKEEIWDFKVGGGMRQAGITGLSQQSQQASASSRNRKASLQYSVFPVAPPASHSKGNTLILCDRMVSI